MLIVVGTPPASAQTEAIVAANQASAAAASAQQAAKAAAKAAEAAASSASAAAVNSSWIPPSDIAIYLVPIIVLFGSLIAILAIRKSLPDSWSLADALSEEVPLPVIKEVTTKGQNGAPDVVTEEPLYDKEGKPVLIPVLKASSSRVIALMGMLSILFMFIGFGTFALYGFGKTGNAPESVSDIVKFLAAGMTLFAPYVVNKFASLFQGLTGSK